MTWTHEHTWTLSAPPERVFAALTDAAQLSRWFAERVVIEPRIGGACQFWGRHTLGAPEAPDPGQVFTRFEPGRAVGFAWTVYGIPTEVRIDLAPQPEGTRLGLRHAVRAPLPLPRPKELIDDHWRLAFGNLAAFLGNGAGIVLPDYTDPNPEVRLSIHIAAPRSAVFKALIDPEAVSHWLQGISPVIEPRAGGRYELGWKYQVDGRDVHGGPKGVLEVVPDRKLVLAWRDWRGDDSVTGQTISFELATEGDGTRLDFVHAGFTRAADISDYPFGWGYFLGRLRSVVEKSEAA